VQVLQKLVDAMNARVQGLTEDLMPTVNSLFGEGITVSGLLPGADFKRQIEAHPGYDRYLIPENALRPWDKRFLDDMLFADLQECTEAEVVTGADTAESFVNAVLG
jgi:NifB/MoaA-like Fe-S oxidoreductase